MMRRALLASVLSVLAIGVVVGGVAGVHLPRAEGEGAAGALQPVPLATSPALHRNEVLTPNPIVIPSGYTKVDTSKGGFTPLPAASKTTNAPQKKATAAKDAATPAREKGTVTKGMTTKEFLDLFTKLPKQGHFLAEIQSHATASAAAEATLEATAEVAVGTPGVWNQAILAGKLGATRTALRKTGDPSKLGDFAYTVDSADRVVSAWGPVTPSTRGKLSDEAYWIADAMFYTDAKVPRPRKDWQTGHVIASASGGDDIDPLNFFPQHAQSNSGGGVWWRVEMVALHASRWMAHKGLKMKSGSQCTVTIEPQLEYATTGNLMPKGGKYRVSAWPECVTEVSNLEGTKLWYAPILKSLLDCSGCEVKTSSGAKYLAREIDWVNDADKATIHDHPELYESDD